MNPYLSYLYTILFTLFFIPVFAGDEEPLEDEEPEVEVPHMLRYSRVMARLSSQVRKFDPFAISMTADGARIQEAPIPVGLEPVEEVPKSENMVQEALGKLSVTGVMPRSKSIVLGGRLVSSGQVLTIKHEGIPFSLRLDDVLGNSLVFTDLETTETVNYSLSILPRGRSGLRKYGAKTFSLPTGAQPMANRIVIE